MNKQNIAAMAAAALTCALALPAAAQNVAIVNGKPIPKERVEILIEQLTKSGRPITAELREQVKEEVIVRELFVQEAERRKLDANQGYRNQMELARQTVLIRELFADFQKNNPVTDAEIQAEYDKAVAANSGKEYKASHILVEKEADAKAILAQLKKGGKFDAIAKKQSKDPGSAAQGGQLGWASPASYVKEFSEAMVKLEKGKTTPAAVKTQFGYHIIRLDDVRDAQLPKLDAVKPQISQQLQQQKLMKFQDELRAKAKIE